MYEWPNLVTLAIATVGTSFVSGIFGMAGGMVLMGLLLVIMPLTVAMALHGITQMASNGWRAWLWREHVRWPVVLRFAAGSMVAVAGFAAMTLRPTKAEALLILGLTPFAALLVPQRARLTVTRRADGVLCGVVCMGLQLVAGVSGPILDVFFVHSGLDRRGIVATKAAVQTLGHALKIVYFGTLLALDGGELPVYVVVGSVLLAFTGTHASRSVLDKLTDTQFLKWSRRLIVAIAVVYLCQGVVLLWREARETLSSCSLPACPSAGIAAALH